MILSKISGNPSDLLTPKNAKQFRKDLKRYSHEKEFMESLQEVITTLLQKKPLDERHVDHPLGGKWKNHRECHVRNDLLLIYYVKDGVLYLERLGTHAELFG